MGYADLRSQKTAVAVALCTPGQGMIKVNGVPLELVQPETLRFKAFEPLLLLGKEKFAEINMRVRVRGGGITSQVYGGSLIIVINFRFSAIRQAIAKGVVAFYQKTHDEATKKEIRDILVTYDRSLIVADPRRCEPKKFGGRGARARYQKSYR